MATECENTCTKIDKLEQETLAIKEQHQKLENKRTELAIKANDMKGLKNQNRDAKLIEKASRELQKEISELANAYKQAQEENQRRKNEGRQYDTEFKTGWQEFEKFLTGVTEEPLETKEIKLDGEGRNSRLIQLIVNIFPLVTIGGGLALANPGAVSTAQSFVSQIPTVTKDFFLNTASAPAQLRTVAGSEIVTKIETGITQFNKYDSIIRETLNELIKQNNIVEAYNTAKSLELIRNLGGGVFFGSIVALFMARRKGQNAMSPEYFVALEAKIKKLIITSNGNYANLAAELLDEIAKEQARVSTVQGKDYTGLTQEEKRKNFFGDSLGALQEKLKDSLEKLATHQKGWTPEQTQEAVDELIKILKQIKDKAVGNQKSHSISTTILEVMLTTAGIVTISATGIGGFVGTAPSLVGTGGLPEQALVNLQNANNSQKALTNLRENVIKQMVESGEVGVKRATQLVDNFIQNELKGNSTKENLAKIRVMLDSPIKKGDQNWPIIFNILGIVLIGLGASKGFNRLFGKIVVAEPDLSYEFLGFLKKLEKNSQEGLTGEEIKVVKKKREEMSDLGKLLQDMRNAPRDIWEQLITLLSDVAEVVVSEDNLAPIPIVSPITPEEPVAKKPSIIQTPNLKIISDLDTKESDLSRLTSPEAKNLLNQLLKGEPITSDNILDAIRKESNADFAKDPRLLSREDWDLELSPPENIENYSYLHLLKRFTFGLAHIWKVHDFEAVDVATLFDFESICIPVIEELATRFYPEDEQNRDNFIKELSKKSYLDALTNQGKYEDQTTLTHYLYDLSNWLFMAHCGDILPEFLEYLSEGLAKIQDFTDLAKESYIPIQILQTRDIQKIINHFKKEGLYNQIVSLDYEIVPLDKNKRPITKVFNPLDGINRIVRNIETRNKIIKIVQEKGAEFNTIDWSDFLGKEDLAP